MSTRTLILEFLFILLRASPVNNCIESKVSPLLPIKDAASLPLISTFIRFPSWLTLKSASTLEFLSIFSINALAISISVSCSITVNL